MPPCVTGPSIADKESVVCEWKGVSKAEVEVLFVGPASSVDMAIMGVRNPARDIDATSTHIWKFMDTVAPHMEFDPSWVADHIEAALKDRRSYARLDSQGFMFHWDDASQIVSVTFASRQLIDRLAALEASPEVGDAIEERQAVKNRVVSARAISAFTPIANPTPQGWLVIRDNDNCRRVASRFLLPN